MHYILYYFGKLKTILILLLLVIVSSYAIKLASECNILRKKYSLLNEELLYYSFEAERLNISWQSNPWHSYSSGGLFDKEIASFINDSDSDLNISRSAGGIISISFDHIEFSLVLDIIHFIYHYHNIYVNSVEIFINAEGGYVMGNITIVKRDSKGT